MGSSVVNVSPLSLIIPAASRSSLDLDRGNFSSPLELGAFSYYSLLRSFGSGWRVPSLWRQEVGVSAAGQMIANWFSGPSLFLGSLELDPRFWLPVLPPFSPWPDPGAASQSAPAPAAPAAPSPQGSVHGQREREGGEEGDKGHSESSSSTRKAHGSGQASPPSGTGELSDGPRDHSARRSVRRTRQRHTHKHSADPPPPARPTPPTPASPPQRPTIDIEGREYEYAPLENVPPELRDAMADQGMSGGKLFQTDGGHIIWEDENGQLHIIRE